MVSTRQSSNMGGSSAGGSVCDTVGEVQPRKQPTNIQPSTSTGLQVVECPVPCQINILQLPEEIQDKIFSYLSFNTIAGLRPVSIIKYFFFNFYLVFLIKMNFFYNRYAIKWIANVAHYLIKLFNDFKHKC